MSEEVLEKSTFERRLEEIMPQLSKDQLRFVIASLDYPTKKDAAEAIGIRVNTTYGWPPIGNGAIKIMATEATGAALAIRRRNLVKAMAVKAAGLDSADESIRQKAATELIEWELGKAGQPVDVTSGGDKIVIRLVNDAD